MKKFLFILFSCLLLASLVVNVVQCHKLNQPQEVKSDTVETIRFDTIRDSFPVPDIRYEKIVKYVPVPDSIFITDTITNEPVLPVIQRRYTDDSTYTAYVSGVKIDSFPRLDSVEVYQKTIDRVITNEIYKRRSRWNFGIQGGYGIGLSSRIFEPYIGVGIEYSFFR